MEAAERLATGVEALGLALDAAAQRRLLDYLDLLVRWNRTYNLTSVPDKETMVSAHLLDSLAVLPYLGSPERLADVGSGAGLPGIPLAIAAPDLPVALIESKQKKASFLTQAKIELGLANVSIYCQRSEELARNPAWQPVGVVISRAFADLAAFIRFAAGLLAEGGRLLAMKGKLNQAELAALPKNWRLAESVSLTIPGLASERNLLILQKA